MPIEEIAVIGGGNGALTAAGDMALAGYKVRMWSAIPEELDRIFDTHTIKVRGVGRTGEAKIDLVTKDLGEAMKGAQVILSMSPAFTQEILAKPMGPYLEDGQILFLSPGSMGSYLMGKIFKDNGYDKDIAIAEPGTLPYLTRKTDRDAVLVSGDTVKLPVGVFPSKKTEETIKTLKELYPSIHPVENALSIALLNVGPIIHSVLMLLNTGPIEHFDSWDIHNEGTTASVKKLILSHDEERIALRKALGFTSHHYPFSDHYDQDSDEYITEDVKCNLALLCSIADLMQFPVPIARSLLTLIGSIVDEDFYTTGRTMHSLGLGDKSIEEITDILRDGL
jgi:opine dehydrogenase